ncbi:Predicted ATPase [Oligella urethralis]|uniref:Predicted ATPase n=1 Tax=Oligella urethralis TaxID=90245 RepID=A0A2N6QAN4_9BURK|nr:hypothetical protein [Oligella urethralis]PMC16548.1 hypothetical protein CJ230_08720 [Oligella urethralis]SPY08719.1 Predicted ATPase [Oligella urethralis]
MIFLSLRVKNFFSFRDVFLDFAIQRKLLNSTIPDESLEGYKNFHFRRVCIISGVNASGKTALGRLMLEIQLFILKDNTSSNKLRDYLFDKSEAGVIEVEFVMPQNKRVCLHRLKLTINQDQSVPVIEYAEIPLRATDTVNSARLRLNKNEASNIFRVETSKDKELDALYAFRERIKEAQQGSCGWFYSFSSVTSDTRKIPMSSESLNRKILEDIVTTFDPTIIKVTENKDESDKTQAFSLIFKNHDSVVLDMEGAVTKPERLSKGTYEALKVAIFLNRIIDDRNYCEAFHDNGPIVYYLDEAMAYVHTELEQLTLSLLIAHLPRHAQLFYTTHNYDVLDMNLPVHSYVFMSKDEEGTSIVQPEQIINKNDRSLLNYVKNNVFNTLPDMSKMELLL